MRFSLSFAQSLRRRLQTMKNDRKFFKGFRPWKLSRELRHSQTGWVPFLLSQQIGPRSSRPLCRHSPRSRAMHYKPARELYLPDRPDDCNRNSCLDLRCPCGAACANRTAFVDAISSKESAPKRCQQNSLTTSRALGLFLPLSIKRAVIAIKSYWKMGRSKDSNVLIISE